MLSKTDIKQGETFSCRVLVEGGKVPQKVDQCYLHLDTSSQYEHNNKLQGFDATIDNFTNNSPFEIDKKTSKLGF